MCVNVYVTGQTAPAASNQCEWWSGGLLVLATLHSLTDSTGAENSLPGAAEALESCKLTWTGAGGSSAAPAQQSVQSVHRASERESAISSNYNSPEMSSRSHW